VKDRGKYGRRRYMGHFSVAHTVDLPRPVIKGLRETAVKFIVFFLNFDLFHVPLLEVILLALFHIYSYNTMLSSSSYILLHTVMA
jgi:hypothetical protein